MSVKRINTATVFEFGIETESVNIVPESGVSYIVAYGSGSEFVEDDAGAQTIPNRVFVQNTKARITPTGGFVTISGLGSF